MNTHTPWNHRPKDLQNPIRYITVEDGGFDRIIAHILPTDKDDAFENAAHIVKCVNLHEELLAALKAVNPRDVDFKTRELIAKAIAKAEGGSNA